jgi:hypothetical protein
MPGNGIIRQAAGSDEVEAMIDGVTNPIPSTTQAPVRIGGGPPSEEARGKPEELAAADAVELSSAAQEEIQTGDARPVRLSLVERVRAEIAADKYLTDDKLDAVVNRLRAELFNAA